MRKRKWEILIGLLWCGMWGALHYFVVLLRISTKEEIEIVSSNTHINGETAPQ